MKKYKVVEVMEVEEMHFVVLDGERVVCRAVYDVEGVTLIRTVRTVESRAIRALKRYMTATLDYMALYELGVSLA